MVTEAWHGLQIVAPDTPYVAAVGQNQLYFIDTRFDNETAGHIKEQLEKAFIHEPEEYIFVDDVLATAEVKNAFTNKTTFVFDPPYARVLFARFMNKVNPELKLREHEPAGDWLKTYNIGTPLSLEKRDCSQHGCHHDSDCTKSPIHCQTCHKARVDNECEHPLVNSAGICHQQPCSSPVDTPKEDGETDASYYQRMDKLHWGGM
jgi:hypothetical protein